MLSDYELHGLIIISVSALPLFISILVRRKALEVSIEFTREEENHPIIVHRLICKVFPGKEA